MPLHAMKWMPLGARVLLVTVAAVACNTARTSLTGTSLTGERAPLGYRNPVVTPVAADPSVVRGPEGRFYLFATADSWADGHGVRYLPRFVSDDLVHWSAAGTVFDERPAWKRDGGLWAPDVSVHDGTYYLYYAYSTWGDPNPCIGLATAPHPEGPWQDLGRPVFCSDDIGVENSIDAFAWYEGEARTLIWGSFHGIYAVALTADGTRAVGEPVLLADRRFEAPYVLQRDGWYYLFLSAGTCCEGAASTYHLLVGRSDALLGPYVDAVGRDLREGGGTLLLQGNSAWAGPGHNAVVTDDAGTAWLLYHAMPRHDARLPNGTNRRQALLDPIAWTSDGWPVVAGGTPGTAHASVPTIVPSTR